jgi:hypothetical protein
MTIYDMAHEYQTLDSLIEDIVSNDDALAYGDLYAGLSGALEDKAENIGKLIRQVQSDEKVISDEIGRLNARKRACENKEARLKYLLSFALSMATGEKIKTPTFSAWLQASSCVTVIDMEAVPNDYTRVDTVLSVDKVAAKAALELGIAIPGLKLETTKSARMR